MAFIFGKLELPLNETENDSLAQTLFSGGFMTALALTIISLVLFAVWMSRKEKKRRVIDAAKREYYRALKVKSEKEKHWKDEEIGYLFAGYNPNEIINHVIQVLGTMDIMSTSKNVDTILGRADLLLKRMGYLSTSTMNDRYSTDIQGGIDRYKSTYYDKKIHDWQLSAVVSPMGFDTNHFNCICLYEGFIRHYEEQLNEISTLKRQSAINNRFDNLLEVFDYFMEHFDKVWHSASANKFKLEKLDKLYEIRESIINKSKIPLNESNEL